MLTSPLAHSLSIGTLFAVLGPNKGGMNEAGPVAIGTIATTGDKRGQWTQLGPNLTWARAGLGVSEVDASAGILYAIILNATIGPPPPPPPFEPADDCKPACGAGSLCCRDPKSPPPGACYATTNCSKVGGDGGGLGSSSYPWPAMLAAFSTSDGGLVRSFPLPMLRTNQISLLAGTFLALDLPSNDALVVGRDIRDGANPQYRLFRVDLDDGNVTTVGDALPCMANAESVDAPSVYDAAAGVMWVPLPHSVPGSPVPESFLRGVDVKSGALLAHKFDFRFNSSSSLNTSNLLYDPQRQRVLGLGRDMGGFMHRIFTLESRTGQIQHLPPMKEGRFWWYIARHAALDVKSRLIYFGCQQNSTIVPPFRRYSNTPAFCAAHADTGEVVFVENTTCTANPEDDYWSMNFL